MTRDFFVSCAVEIGADSCGHLIYADIKAGKVSKSPPTQAGAAFGRKIEQKY